MKWDTSERFQKASERVTGTFGNESEMFGKARFGKISEAKFT